VTLSVACGQRTRTALYWESKPRRCYHLVEQLSPDEQLKLVQEIKQQELRRELMIGVEQLNRGEKISGEQVFQELRERHTERINESK